MAKKAVLRACLNCAVPHRGLDESDSRRGLAFSKLHSITRTVTPGGHSVEEKKCVHRKVVLIRVSVIRPTPELEINILDADKGRMAYVLSIQQSAF